MGAGRPPAGLLWAGAGPSERGRGPGVLVAIPQAHRGAGPHPGRGEGGVFCGHQRRFLPVALRRGVHPTSGGATLLRRDKRERDKRERIDRERERKRALQRERERDRREIQRQKARERDKRETQRQSDNQLVQTSTSRASQHG